MQKREPLTKKSSFPMEMVMHLNMGKVHHSSYRNHELGISKGKRSEKLPGGKYLVTTSWSFDEKSGDIYDNVDAFIKAYNDHFFPEKK